MVTFILLVNVVLQPTQKYKKVLKQYELSQIFVDRCWTGIYPKLLQVVLWESGFR